MNYDNENQKEQDRHPQLNPRMCCLTTCPSNVSNTKAWVTNIRKDLSAALQKQFDSHVNKMLKVIEDKKFKQDELQTIATRWGLPFYMAAFANAATPKNLQSIIAVATWRNLQRILSYINQPRHFAEFIAAVDELQAVMQFFQFLVIEVPNVSKEL